MFEKAGEKLERMELRAIFIGSKERLNEAKKTLEDDFEQFNEHKIGLRVEHNFEFKEKNIFSPINKKESGGKSEEK